MVADSLVNSHSELVAYLQIFRRKPTPHAFGLQIIVQSFGKVLILAGITYKAGIELGGSDKQRGNLSHKLVRDAAPSQKDFGDLAFRPVNIVNADSGRRSMLDVLSSIQG